VSSPTPAYVIVIPARYDSVRLPGKPLRLIGSAPMIEHVWRAARLSGASEVVVATDDERILEVVEGFGGRAVMTRRDHASGSDRIAECAGVMGWDGGQLIVNLQGDEPEMPPACLDQVAELLAGDPGAAAATLYRPIDSAEEVGDPNAVKVVVSERGQALYFSRSPIPYARGHASVGEALQAGHRWYRHIGLYCYRLAALRSFAAQAPTPLERAEHLEQLRFLEYGERIVIAEASRPIPAGIDTEADLAKVRTRI